MSRLQIIICRKFRCRIPDLELLVMLELANRPSTYAELLKVTEASKSGTWNAVQQLVSSHGLVESENINGRDYYSLSPKGTEELRNLLN